MDKSRGLVLGVVAVLVVGAGSASVLDSFGSISGTADVEGPVFYTGSGDRLYLNYSDEYSVSLVSSQVYEYSFDENLDWYSSNFDIIATLDREGNEFNTTMVLSYFDKNGDEVEVCDKTREVTSSSEITFECSMQSTTVSGFKLDFTSDYDDSGDGEAPELVQGENTFVEVNSSE